MGIGENVGENIGENTGQSGDINEAVSGATLFYENTFESGWDEPIVRFHGGCYSYSFTLVPSQSGQVARVENRGAEDNTNCPDEYYSTKHRAQIAFWVPERATILNQYGEGNGYWVGFRMYIPNDWPLNVHDPLMFQFIGSPWGSLSHPEFLAIMHKDGVRLRIQKYWADINGSNQGNINMTYVTMPKGEWANFVIYHQRALVNDGNIGVNKVWMDGEQIVDDTGPNAIPYKQQVGPAGEGHVFFHFGIYWGSTSNNSTFVTYYDSVRMAVGDDDTNGYALVDPTQQPS